MNVKTISCEWLSSREPPDEELLRELLSNDMLCSKSVKFVRDATNQITFDPLPPSSMHWSRIWEWPWAIRAVLLEGKTVLNAGGGHSVMTCSLAKRCQHVIVADLDTDSLKHVKTQRPFTNHRNISTVVWDLIDLPQQWSDRFDVVQCLPAGSIVSGVCTPIEDLQEGSIVRNSLGRDQKVVETFTRKHTGDVFVIKADCLLPVTLTPEHPVLIGRVSKVHRSNKKNGSKARNEYVCRSLAWKAAKDIVPGDWVTVPRIQGEEGFRFSYCKGRSKTVFSGRLNDNLAWLLGAYVAEGSTCFSRAKPHQRHNSGRIVFSLGSTEDQFAEGIIRRLSEVGLHAFISRPRPERKVNTLSVLANSLEFARLLDLWCGKGAKQKRVPEFIKKASVDVIRSFIVGLVEGDGCVNGGMISLGTASKQLAYGVLELLHKIGISAGMLKRENSGHGFVGRVLSGGPLYVVSWSKRTWDGCLDNAGRSAYGRSRFIGNDVFLKVKKVDRVSVRNLPVYNMHTVDETYGVPFTVHNCISVLEHVPNYRKALSEMLRVLKPGGKLVLTCDCEIVPAEDYQGPPERCQKWELTGMGADLPVLLGGGMPPSDAAMVGKVGEQFFMVLAAILEKQT